MSQLVSGCRKPHPCGQGTNQSAQRQPTNTQFWIPIFNLDDAMPKRHQANDTDQEPDDRPHQITSREENHNSTQRRMLGLFNGANLPVCAVSRTFSEDCSRFVKFTSPFLAFLRRPVSCRSRGGTFFRIVSID